VQERRIVVRRFATLKELEFCHILFVSGHVDRRDWAAVIEKLAGAPTLIVGESTGFTAQGGAFNFYVQDNRVKIEANVQAAKARGLKISSKLLAIARITDAR
jgi:hypothetical protein